MATSTSAMSALSSMRMSGLASGMDTESMVKSLMRMERMKYDKLVRQKTQMDWREEANLGVNNLLRTFRDDYLSILKPENYMMNASSVQIYKVAMDASQNVKIMADKDALPGSHVIDSITSLASGAHAASGAAVSAGSISLDAPMSSLALSTPLEFDDDELSFAINGKTFSFGSGDSLRTVINRVNSDVDANVLMSYSSLTGKISIANKDMGVGSALSIANMKGNAFDLGSPAFGIAMGPYANGTDAVLSIDGINVVRDTNNFTIDGIAYKLNDPTAVPVKFTVEQDIDGAVTKVKKFVDAYNTLISKLDELLTEKRNAGYMPLTDEEREAMSDTQAEKWEKMAKSGILNGDDYLEKLVQDLRRSFFDNVADSGGNAAKIGLGTMSYLTKGTIQVDEAKLRKALQNDAQQVAKIFSNTSSSTNVATKYQESGLAARIQTSLNSFINDATGYRQDSFNDKYDRIDKSMLSMERLLQAKEERYWRQFSQMESALSRMNSQSSWLSQQFASKG